MEKTLKALHSAEKLSYEQMTVFFDDMVNEKLTPAQIGGTLIAMKMRGETADDIAAAATVLNNYKIPLKHNLKDCMDTCGTGGDGKSTMNVSTLVSITLASMGLNIIKHGNSAQSGKVGSADILNLLGIPTKLTGDEAVKYLKKHNFIFLFAPNYHPILKSVGAIRRQLMAPTIFNYLGPLLNPGEPDFQIIGINSVEKLGIYSEAVLRLKKNNIMVVSSADGYDEITSSDVTYGKIIKDGQIENIAIDPGVFFKKFPMPKVVEEKDAIKFFMESVSGTSESLNNILALNSAYALSLKESEDIKSLFDKVKKHLASGGVEKYLHSLKAGD